LDFGHELPSKSQKNIEILSFFTIFSIFEAEAQPSALKIQKTFITKVVSNECLQLFRQQLLSIFEFEIFPYKSAPA
jgi:hypothetical protein